MDLQEVQVTSQTTPNVVYTVKRFVEKSCAVGGDHPACEEEKCRHLCRGMYSCTCYDFLTATATCCKHVHAVHAAFYRPESDDSDNGPEVTVIDDDSVDMCT